MTTTTGSMPVAARAASRLSTRARSHAVEIAQGVLVAVFIAAVVMLLLATGPRPRPEVDLARHTAATAPLLS